MESVEGLLTLLIGGTAILGIVGSIAYYFARFGFKSDYERDLAKAEQARQSEAGGRAETTTGESEAKVPPIAEAAKGGAPVPGATSAKDLHQALAKTRSALWGRIQSLFVGEVPSDVLEQVEEVLFTSDLGVATVQRLLQAVESRLSKGDKADVAKVHEALKQEMLSILSGQSGASSVLEALGAGPQDDLSPRPQVWLVVGVNGAGKTTSIGKIAHELAQSGRKVLVAAGDTFRAAAGEQLRVWTERAQVEIFAPEGVLDPAAVAYQAVEKAKGQDFDVVIVDTAGRLHTQKNLMEELKKVQRVLQKLMAEAPHQTLLVLDANSGQNAMVQARQFHEALSLTGVILTKMDGTAKGGVALSLACELQIPVRLIGVGEAIGDLRPFQPSNYVDSLL